jgi:predicted O-methyltransferase YrrM
VSSVLAGVRGAIAAFVNALGARDRAAGAVPAEPAPGVAQPAAVHPSDVPRMFVPPGHFYSPLPTSADVEEAARRAAADPRLGGIDLQDEEQMRLLEELADFYPEIPFASEPRPGLRYRFDNPSYSYADGVFLYSMIRRFRPRRIIEVGSGFTSALILDVNERFFDNTIACTFVEPYPDLLHSLLTDDDRRRARIIPARLQDVDLALFDPLGANDILFIDSTHVSKANSDVNRLFFEILPRLAQGTVVHLHDIFPALEYPIEWMREGRAWNEQYVLRAFLQYNAAYTVRLFGSYMVTSRPDWFRSRMPLCLRNPGGAFWMQRTR